MRTTILSLGLGLLLASPAFAAKAHHRHGAAKSAVVSGKKTVAGPPAGETKPAEGTKTETPKKAHTGKHKAKKAAEGEKPAETAK